MVPWRASHVPTGQLRQGPTYRHKHPFPSQRRGGNRRWRECQERSSWRRKSGWQGGSGGSGGGENSATAEECNNSGRRIGPKAQCQLVGSHPLIRVSHRNVVFEQHKGRIPDGKVYVVWAAAQREVWRQRMSRHDPINLQRLLFDQSKTNDTIYPAKHTLYIHPHVDRQTHKLYIDREIPKYY